MQFHTFALHVEVKNDEWVGGFVDFEGLAFSVYQVSILIS